MSDAHEEIATFLSEWATAEVNGDVADLEARLTDDFTGIGPLGFILPKKEWLARHAPGALQYQSFQVQDPQIRLYGGDAAVVVAHQVQNGTHQGRPIPAEARITLVLAKEAGWRLAHVHYSFMAGTPGSPPIPGRS